MTTLEHAKKEFEILENWDKSNEDNKPIILEFKEEILALVGAFGKSGQSGGSAPYTASAISQAVKKLCLHEPMGPITGDSSEWTEIAEESDKPLFQNNRLSSVFKEGEDGQSYFLDAIIFQGEEDWYTFTGTVEGVWSGQFIKSFPFYPKTFYVDVEEDKANGEYRIKNPEQLKEVFEYYDRKA